MVRWRFGACLFAAWAAAFAAPPHAAASSRKHAVKIAPSMTWFRVKHAQITDIAEGSAGAQQVGIYADGEWHAASCHDTIPDDGPTVITLGHAQLVVPPAAWEAQDSHTFSYMASSPTRLWHVSLDIDSGTWWVWLVDQDARAWRSIDVLPVEMRLNTYAAHEALLMRTPKGRDDVLGYYQAGVAPMTCFSVSSLAVNRAPHERDWWSSYVHLQGTYNLSDCRQSAQLKNVGARLRIGWTSLVVPVGGFKPAAQGWYTYTHQSNTLTWWLSVHPSSGMFRAHVWSTAADITTRGSHVDVSLQLRDQMGEVRLQGAAPNNTAGYTVRSSVHSMCPAMH